MNSVSCAGNSSTMNHPYQRAVENLNITKALIKMRLLLKFMFLLSLARA